MLDAAPASATPADLRRAMDKAGMTRLSAISKKGEFFELYQLTNLVLVRAYEHVAGHANAADALASLLSSLTALLKKQPALGIAYQLMIMQSGIATLVQDKRRAIFGGSVVASCATNVSHDHICVKCDANPK